MARLDAFSLTLDMSPTAQNLFDIEPLEFIEDSLVFNATSLEITGVSQVDGQSYLVRAFFTIVSQTQAVVQGFDVFNSNGSPAASVTGLNFPISTATDPFGLGLASFLTGSDQISGAAGNDQIFGGSGNDGLNGGAGNDTAIYLGSSDQYDIQALGAQVQVTDTFFNRDGVDLLSDIELFQFSDGQFTLSDLIDPQDIANAVYRFFNNATGTHFYTASADERDAVIDSGASFVFEGPAFKGVDASDPGADPVFRFFNTQTGVHFYTISTDERDAIVATLPEFVLEGVAYSAHDTAEAGTVPLFRFFNTNTGTHFYSASAEERDVILDTLPEFTFEGTAYFVEGIA